MVVFFQLDGEGDDAVLRQRGDVADGALQFVAADLDNGFAAGGDAVAIGVGYLTLDLEMREVGDDGDLGAFAYLGADLVVHVGQDRLAGGADLGIVERALGFGEAFAEDVEFELLHFQIGFGKGLFVDIFLFVFLEF